MLVCALCSFEQTFLPGLAVSDGEIFGRLLAGCQWSDGLDNSVGACGCLCVLGSAYVVLWDCQTPRKSLPTLLSSQLQQPIVWHVNSIKIICFTGFFKSWSWI